MDLNSRFQQMALAGQGQKLGLSQVRPSRPAVVVVPTSGQERTYMNVNSAAVATGAGAAGQVQMINNSHGFVSSRGGPNPIQHSGPIHRPTSVPAIPRSQAVKRFMEPSYSTILQLQTDLSKKKYHEGKTVPVRHAVVVQQQHQQQQIYANIGGGSDYIYNDGLRSSDSQGSTTEEELLCLANTGLEPRNSNYFASPPSPVSSSYSELRLATRGAHPMGGYIYQHQVTTSPAANPNSNYDSVYEPVLPRGQPPPLLSRQALIQHQQVLSSDYFGNCFKCGGKIVGEGSGCSAMAKLYHIACFRCHTCQCLLQGKPFYALDGKPFCEADYLNTLEMEGKLEKCCKCQKPILDRILRATGKPYHPQCFTCVVCSRSLDGVPFTVDATNQIHCIEDFHRKFAPRCSVCTEPIMPEPGLEETVRVVALDRSFHVKCYKCEDCGLLLSSGAEGHGCYPLDDHVLCKQCNTRRIQLLTQKI